MKQVDRKHRVRSYLHSMKFGLLNAFRVVVLLAVCSIEFRALGEEPTKDTTHTIFGYVVEHRAGTRDVPVCLCDMASGLPVDKETYKPIEGMKTSLEDLSNSMAIVVTDSKGKFQFENVPDGKYRVVAQRWIGSYKGLFEVHGTVIQLMGIANDIVVPRPADYYKSLVGLSPLGNGIVHFDQEVGNDETFLFLSTSPLEFDPILGLDSMGKAFRQNLIGINRMPGGKTTVIGVPDKAVYAFLFAGDNLPGYAALTVPESKSGLVRMPAEPFVAAWSNGRKTPPPPLADLTKFLEKHSFTVSELLEIPKLSNATHAAYRARMMELSKELPRVVTLPEERSARVGDLLAVEAYLQLQKSKR